MEQSFVYRPAEADDALRLSILFQTVYIDTYGVDGVTHEFARFIVQRFSPQRIAELIAQRADNLFVATNGEHLVGAAELLWEQACPIDGRVGPELSKLYILERYCGHGVGKGLLRRVEEAVREKGAQDLWLEVWAENPRAIAFYGRQGFEDLGRNDFQMEVNCYENRVLRKALGDADIPTRMVFP